MTEQFITMSEDDNIAHQLNAYFGVFYPIELEDKIADILKENPLYRPLVDESEVVIDGHLLFHSSNSDFTDNAKYNFIAVDQMTISGEMYEHYDDVQFEVDPARMENLEKRYRVAVEIVTDLRNYLVKKCADTKPRKFYCGWNILHCVWDEKDESD